MEALHRLHVCVPYRIELCHCTCSTGSVRRMVAACNTGRCNQDATTDIERCVTGQYWQVQYDYDGTKWLNYAAITKITLFRLLVHTQSNCSLSQQFQFLYCRQLPDLHLL